MNKIEKAVVLLMKAINKLCSLKPIRGIRPVYRITTFIHDRKQTWNRYGIQHSGQN